MSLDKIHQTYFASNKLLLFELANVIAGFSDLSDGF